MELRAPEILLEKIGELQQINQITENPSDEAAFSLGLFLRDDVGAYYYEPGRNELAIKIFRKLIASYPDSSYVDKSLYLMASSYRRLRDYANSKRVLEEFLATVSESSLLDDVIAELGAHYLLVENNLDKARPYFERVVSEFSDQNASDNALNWMAWANMRLR